jgi:hypothetical protein
MLHTREDGGSYWTQNVTRRPTGEDAFGARSLLKDWVRYESEMVWWRAPAREKTLTYEMSQGLHHETTTTHRPPRAIPTPSTIPPDTGSPRDAMSPSEG